MHSYLFNVILTQYYIGGIISSPITFIYLGTELKIGRYSIKSSRDYQRLVSKNSMLSNSVKFYNNERYAILNISAFL